MPQQVFNQQRVVVYMPADLYAALVAEAERMKAHSMSDAVRRILTERVMASD